MNEKEQQVYCNHCKEKVTWHIEPVNHQQQFFLTLFTLGMWAPIWIALTLMKIRCCDKCNATLYDE